MIRRCLFLALIIACAGKTAAQEERRWLLGAGATYCSFLGKPGVNLNVTYRMIGNLHIGPDFSAILNDEKRENGNVVIRKELEYNLNAHYLFDLGEKVAVYPLIGFCYSKVTYHPRGENADKRWVSALNSGGGIEINWSTIRLFFETKYVTKPDKYDLTLGILLEL